MTDGPDQRPLRILTVTNLWPVDGGFRGIFVREFVEVLGRLGHHVDVEVVAQRRGRLDYLLAAPRVWRRVRHGGYDVVHVHYGLTALSACLVRRVPRVLTLYGSDINVDWQRRVTRLTSAGTAARVYLSQASADKAGDPAGAVIPNGVDFTLFAPRDRNAARAAYGFGPDDRVLLFGADPANSIKGYDVFAAVLAELRTRGIPARELVLAAPGQPRSEVPGKFAAADALLFTSNKGFESSPTVVKEASAMGLPVVSVAVGDVRQVLSGVTPSAVVDYPDPWGGEEARDSLVRELADRTAEVLAAGGRSNGREANPDLDSERVAQRVVEIYRRVAGAGAGADQAGVR
jgi:glycosyltransferase involved in cell wall biosynthesis